MEFRLKRIQFFSRDVNIVCQNENGPCPLIAIANVLLLQGKLEISTDLAFISLESLSQLIADQVLQHLERRNDGVPSKEHTNAIMRILPNMAKGLDLNISFSGVDKFEYTEEVTIFDALGIPLLHGWLYDPLHEADGAEAVGSQSYNHLMFKMIEYLNLIERLQSEYATRSEEEIKGDITEEQQILLRDGRIIDGFLRRSASQLTYHGLVKLYEYLNDRQLAVFFRNNHFSTMFFYNGQIFLLMTDLGYFDQAHVVWELLENIKGGSEFYNADFIPTRELNSPALDVPLAPIENQADEAASPPHNLPIPVGADQDYILALQMQIEEEASANSPPPQAPAPYIEEYGMSQDELDHQTAIMMQYEVNRAAKPNRQRGRGGPQAIRVEHPNYEGQGNCCNTAIAGGGNKSSSCSIC